MVVTHFAEISEYNVDWMLNSFGAHLRDPRLVPALRQILADWKGPDMDGERTAVIRQLVKIDPQNSRNQIVHEVCSDNFTLDQYLGELPFPTLVETDDCLRRTIDMALSARDPLPLQSATHRIAKFATPALYDDLFALYRKSGATWDKQAQGFLLAYLIRWNPQRGLPLLEAALPKTTSDPDFNITYALGNVGFIPALDGFWRDCLAKSPPEMAAQAAFQMSENGPAEDQQLLRARLNDWRTNWQGRAIPTAEARFEGELTRAVMIGTNWQLSNEDKQTLASGCLSDDCRTRFAHMTAH